MSEIVAKKVLAELTKKYLAEFMPQILPGLISRLMADILAKPGEICSDWLENMDPHFDLEGFITGHYERPFKPEELAEILADYEPEDAVLMVYALAAYIHYNRLLVEFPGSRKKSKPGPKPDGRKKGRRKQKKTAPLAGKKDTSLPANAFKKKKFAAAYRDKFPGPAGENLLQALSRSFNEHSESADWEKAMKKAGLSAGAFNGGEFYAWRSDPAIKKQLVSKSGID